MTRGDNTEITLTVPLSSNTNAAQDKPQSSSSSSYPHISNNNYNNSNNNRYNNNYNNRNYSTSSYHGNNNYNDRNRDYHRDDYNTPRIDDKYKRPTSTTTTSTPTSSHNNYHSSSSHNNSSSSSRAVDPSVDSLPAPWKAVVDKNTGKTYYWNTDTNITSWEKPK